MLTGAENTQCSDVDEMGSFLHLYQWAQERKPQVSFQAVFWRAIVFGGHSDQVQFQKAFAFHRIIMKKMG